MMGKPPTRPPPIAEIRTAVSARREWGIKSLQELISIDSISPHEKHCQLALADILKAEDLNVELIPLDDGALRSVDGFVDAGFTLEDRPNLVASYGGKGSGGKSLILNAHIDTVTWIDQLEKWIAHPLSGELIGNKIYGRGAMDDKGMIIAAAKAILALKDLGYEPPGQVMLTSVVGEEPSGNGTLALCAQGYLADAAINLEATDNHVVYGHRGIIGLRYQTFGEARHASVGSALTNPIVQVGRLGLILNNALEGWNHPSDIEYGAPSMNVGKICGGDDIFTTPQGCKIECGVRYAPGTYASIMKHIDQYLHVHAPEGMVNYDQVAFDELAHYDAAQIDPETPLVQEFLASVQEIIPDRSLKTFAAGCDARHLINRYNVPTVIFGPSQIRLAHAENEYLDLHQWQLATEALALFITRWCL
jgi:acetylornithine deacetylase